MNAGFLNIAKPAGMTSRDVVNRVAKLARPAKVGHAGTLDPLATGVLVVAVGAATRLIQYVQRMSKSYVGTFLLGRTSASEDTEGEVVELADPPVPTLDAIQAALPSFVGEILQRPPAFSAIKVQGRRAYDLARRGREVDLAPRPIAIYGLSVARYEYPELTLAIQCGSGTYVRSLGRDLAESLGTGAVMSALVRESIGCFRLEEAIELDSLQAELWHSHLLPLATGVAGLKRIDFSDAELTRLRHGQRIAGDWAAPPGTELAAFDSRGCLRGIAIHETDGVLKPVCNLSSEDGAAEASA